LLEGRGLCSFQALGLGLGTLGLEEELAGQVWESRQEARPVIVCRDNTEVLVPNQG
jgi:hypothetical protein